MIKAASNQSNGCRHQSHLQARILLDLFLLLLSGSLEMSLLRSMSTVHAWTSWTHTCARLTVRMKTARLRPSAARRRS